jgi:UPF0716 protein FxsA
MHVFGVYPHYSQVVQGSRQFNRSQWREWKNLPILTGMGFMILALLLGWPVLEIAVFIKVGAAIGLFQTLLLFILSGFIGMMLIRAEGFALLMRAEREMRRGRIPLNEAFDALCLAAAGALLILPGFVSDVFAIALILPPVRKGLRWLIARYAARREVTLRAQSGIVDGEYEDVTPPPTQIVHRRD